MAGKNNQLQIADRKTRQKTKLLAEQPKFKSEIKRLRKKWNIPEDGFQDYEEFNSWETAFNEQNRVYQQVKYPEFITKFKKEPDYGERLKEFNKKAPNNELQSDLAILIKTQKLSPLWIQGLRGYLLRNFMPIPAGLIVEISTDPITDSPILKLVLQEDTTIKDIQSAWREISEYQKKLPYWRKKKSQPMPYFERNKRAYELKQAGKSYKEIAEILTKELKTEYDYTQILDFIQSHEKQIGKTTDES